MPSMVRQACMVWPTAMRRWPLSALCPQGVCDSGQKSGRRRLSRRGSVELRRLLYNCSQATARTLAWKSYYTQLKSGEFSTAQALVITARKLLRIAFSLWQQPGMQLNAQKMACLGSIS
jgi:transposase